MYKIVIDGIEQSGKLIFEDAILEVDELIRELPNSEIWAKYLPKPRVEYRPDQMDIERFIIGTSNTYKWGNSQTEVGECLTAFVYDCFGNLTTKVVIDESLYVKYEL